MNELALLEAILAKLTELTNVSMWIHNDLVIARERQHETDKPATTRPAKRRTQTES